MISGGAHHLSCSRFSCLLRDFVMIIQCTFAETRASKRVFHPDIDAASQRDIDPRITYTTSISVFKNPTTNLDTLSKCFSNASVPPTSSPLQPQPLPQTPPQYKPSTHTPNPLGPPHHPSIRPVNISPSTATRLHTSTSAPANDIATTAPKPPPCMVSLLHLPAA